MIMVRLFLLMIIFVWGTACATTPIAGECKETTSERCLTGKVCALDKGRNCLVCHCEEPVDYKNSKDLKRIQGDEPPDQPVN